MSAWPTRQSISARRRPAKATFAARGSSRRRCHPAPRLIHPGYGFLSENPDFVDRVVAAGLVFIGPSAASIRAMGLKDAAKVLMEKAGVPVVPGYHGEGQGQELLAAKAREIGYPVLIKARAGGGGKGMRRVDHPDEFADALAGARREAKVRLRRRPCADREICRQAAPHRSAGVRRQFRQCGTSFRARLLGAAPSPEGDRGSARARHDRRDALRHDRGGGERPPGPSAIRAPARSSSSWMPRRGFRADRFWFMEMNTRLQVEHPVTEMITGRRSGGVAAQGGGRRAVAENAGGNPSRRPRLRGKALRGGRGKGFPAGHRHAASPEISRNGATRNGDAGRDRRARRRFDLALLRSDDRETCQPWAGSRERARGSGHGPGS